MMRSLVGLARHCLSRFSQNDTKDFLSDIEYWRARVKQYGRRSVLNIEHKDDAYDRVTADQKARIFPIFESQLRGDERTVLDFGCGPGRFTPDLAKIVQGCCIGVDPIEDFLDIAPRSDFAEYLQLHNGVIPLLDSSMDVVWICLVLGGITSESELERTASEINRVLKENGLVFLVENTSGRPDSEHWKYRSFERYRALFHFAPLSYLSDYYDLGERISIMAGRKSALVPAGHTVSKTGRESTIGR